MADNKIFFSYSRDNSEFVIELAKELREAGASIWLDQLDIKPGTRWDRSIEQALQSSNTLLIVLSKSSVASHNVMDEVSYALEENRTVVPVLFEECEIPFRLRRLQYADFTQSHKKGIETLIKALNLESDVANKLVDIAQEVENTKKTIAPTPVPEKQKEETLPKADPIAAPLEEPKVVGKRVETEIRTPAANTTNSNSGMGKLLPVLLGVAALVIAGIFLVPKFMGDDGTTDKSTNEDVVENSPNEDPTIVSPQGGTSTATTPDETTEPEINEEEIAWSLAKEQNEIDGYLFYLNKYPEMGDERSQEFESSIKGLFNREGYIQYSQSNGSSYFEKVYPQNTPPVPPIKGYLIKANYSRNVKAGSYGTPGFSRSLSVLEKDGYAVIEEIIPSGSAYWIKIKY